MIGVQKERIANWCNHNIDLLIVTSGALILGYIEIFDSYLNLTIAPDYGFWALLLGVVTLSIGIAALICYRVLLRWHSFFSA